MGGLDVKHGRLKHILKDCGSVLVAFSGGVDSTLLLKVARDVLGGRALAVTASSEIYPPGEVEEAGSLARLMGAEHLVIATPGLESPAFAGNPIDRCYHCKKDIYHRLLDLAGRRGLNCVIDGVNADDAGDYRPGIRAGIEMGVRSPLGEAGLTKLDVRALSRELGLPTAGKPAGPCLASRFPYGMEITREGLKQVALSEDFLRSLGVPGARVRHHGSLARIEVPREYLQYVAERSKEVSARLKEIGYTYVSLDLRGYRAGAMNETLIENTTLSSRS